MEEEQSTTLKNELNEGVEKSTPSFTTLSSFP